MLFNSHLFVFGFLPLALVGYFGLGRISERAAVGWLAAMSLAFYAWWNPAFLWLLGASITANFCAALLLSRAQRGRAALLSAAIGLNLGLLGYFKYANFLLSNVSLPTLDIVLPLGISFFTFTQIAFLVDVHRRRADEYNFLNYILFVTYFPHLIAGPILHHKEMMPQFADAANKRFNPHLFAAGIAVFAIGLLKKVGLADHVAGMADAVFLAPSQGLSLSVAEAWIGSVAYALQIYFDFSGYSDMAVGLSLMFGVVLPLNFNSPYQSDCIIDFWRRWHMTLSRFLRDYLYFALGGNRRGTIRRHINLMITMVLGGLWHGASWNFVLWGALHGLYLLINHGWRQILGQRFSHKGWRPFFRLLTFLAVVAAWVPFRAPDLQTTKSVAAALFGLDGVGLPVSWSIRFHQLAATGLVHFDGALPNDLFGDFRGALRGLGVVLLVALFAPSTQRIVPMPGATDPIFRPLHWRPSPLWGGAVGVMLAVGVLLIGGESPFLYFRF